MIDKVVEPYLRVSEMISSRTEHKPTIAMHNKKGIEVMQMVFASGTKHEWAKVIHERLTKLNADFYVFISEAYMKMGGKKESSEVLFLMFVNRVGFVKMWLREILRDNENRRIGLSRPVIWDNRKGENVDGLFVLKW